MDVTLQYSLFVVLLLTATGGADGLQCFGEYCFALPDPARSMVQSDARTYCNNSGTRLLEVGTREALAAVQRFFNSTSGQSNYFTGNDVIMNADQDKRGDMYTWVNWNSVSGVTVVPGTAYPQDYYAYAYLERTSSAVQMYGGLTTNRYGYICEYDSTWQPCVFPSNNRCFVSSSETVTWFEARNRCLLNGGDLAVFDYIGSDPGMNQLSGDWLTINAKYWVGARRVYWTWNSTGSDVRYTNFAAGKPSTYNFGCLCLSRATQWQQWTDCNCSIAYPFLCFTVVPTTTPGSTTTLPSSLSTSSSSASTTRTSSTASTTTTTPPSTSDLPSPSFNPGSTSVLSTRNPDLTIAIGVGLGVGLGVLLLLIILIIFLVIRRRRKKSKSDDKLYEEITYETHGNAEDNNYEGSELKENNYEGLNKDGSEFTHAYEPISEIGIEKPAKEDVPP